MNIKYLTNYFQTETIYLLFIGFKWYFVYVLKEKLLIIFMERITLRKYARVNFFLILYKKSECLFILLA